MIENLLKKWRREIKAKIIDDFKIAQDFTSFNNRIDNTDILFLCIFYYLPFLFS